MKNRDFFYRWFTELKNADVRYVSHYQRV